MVVNVHDRHPGLRDRFTHRTEATERTVVQRDHEILSGEALGSDLFRAGEEGELFWDRIRT